MALDIYDDDDDDPLEDSVIASFMLGGREYMDLSGALREIEEEGLMDFLLQERGSVIMLTTPTRNKELHPDPALDAAWIAKDVDCPPQGEVGPWRTGGYQA